MTDDTTAWDAAYTGESHAPWDIQRPQPAVQELADLGLLSGRVLDAGCGTGEHTLLASACGAHAVGVDLSSVAIERARAKAAQRGLAARFEAGDVLSMALPEEAFDVIIDSGLFHIFNDLDRLHYVRRLRSLIPQGGRCYVLCFSDRQPGDWGPRRIRREEILVAFAHGWSVQRIDPIRFEINPLPQAAEVHGWRAELVAE